MLANQPAGSGEAQGAIVIVPPRQSADSRENSSAVYAVYKVVLMITYEERPRLIIGKLPN